MKKYYKIHKEKILEYNKKFYKIHKEEIKEQRKKYRENHKEQTKEYWKKYYEAHNEYFKKYCEDHKEEIKEQKKKYREIHKDEIYKKNKEYNEKYSKYSRYFRKNFSRFITLKNYITIMKLGDESLLRSIMIRLGKGVIDQDEAVALSGMAFTEDDLKEVNEWVYNVSKGKSTLS